MAPVHHVFEKDEPREIPARNKDACKDARTEKRCSPDPHPHVTGQNWAPLAGSLEHRLIDLAVVQSGTVRPVCAIKVSLLESIHPHAHPQSLSAPEIARYLQAPCAFTSAHVALTTEASLGCDLH